MSNLKLVVLLIFSALNLVAMPGWAGEIMRSISFSEQAGKVEIKANFGANVRYVKHFPMSRGKIVQIQIEIDKKTFGEDDQKRRETLDAPGGIPVALKDAIYEGNVRGGPYLVLRFDDVVNFTLGRESDSKYLTVSVEKPAPESNTASTADNASPAAAIGDAKGNSIAESLIIAGRQALTRGDNNEAVIKFTELLAMEENAFTQDAKEYLGLARERSGQLDMAKAQYEEYLKLYEKSPKASTVRQRLMTLNARIEDTERRLKEAKRQQTEQLATEKRTENFGRISIIGYGAVNETGNDANVSQKRVMAFFDDTLRWRKEGNEGRLVASMSGDQNFASSQSTTSSNERLRVRSFFGEFKWRDKKLTGSLGRQSVNSGGVLGRLDGALVGYEIKPTLRAFGVYGFPVEYQEYGKIQRSRPMYGGRLDIDDFVKDWKATVYGIEQRVDGILDRRAVGGDLRYFQAKKLFYSVVDYDVSFRVLNFVTSHLGFQYDDVTKVDVHLDFRKSPILLMSNAKIGVLANQAELIGLTAEDFRNNPSMAYMKSALTPEQIRELAINNTGSSALATFGVTRDFTKDLQFNGTATYSRYEVGNLTIIEPDPTANPADKTPGAGDITVNYSVAGQLLKRNALIDRDIVIGGFRASQDDKSSNTGENRQVSANLTYRRPYLDKWWLDLRGRVLYNKTLQTGDGWIRYSPSVRAEHRYSRDLTFEFEISTDITPNQNGQSSRFTYANGGFRYMF